jgi:predicted nuclease with TOPRIM domain
MFEKLSPNVRAALLTIAFTFLAGIVGAAYNIGYGNGAKDLEAVSDFKKSLPTMMESLNKLAKDFGQRMETVEENQRLTSALENANNDVKRLEKNLAEFSNVSKVQKEQIANLENQISKLFPDTEIPTVISLGSAERVIPNALTIGLVSIYGTFVDVRINGSSYNLSAGEEKIVSVAGRDCHVELVKIDKVSSNFNVSCVKK